MANTSKRQRRHVQPFGPSLEWVSPAPAEAFLQSNSKTSRNFDDRRTSNTEPPASSYQSRKSRQAPPSSGNSFEDSLAIEEGAQQLGLKLEQLARLVDTGSKRIDASREQSTQANKRVETNLTKLCRTTDEVLEQSSQTGRRVKSGLKQLSHTLVVLEKQAVQTQDSIQQTNKTMTALCQQHGQLQQLVEQVACASKRSHEQMLQQDGRTQEWMQQLNEKADQRHRENLERHDAVKVNFDRSAGYLRERVFEVKEILCDFATRDRNDSIASVAQTTDIDEAVMQTLTKERVDMDKMSPPLRSAAHALEHLYTVAWIIISHKVGEQDPEMAQKFKQQLHISMSNIGMALKGTKANEDAMALERQEHRKLQDSVMQLQMSYDLVIAERDDAQKALNKVAALRPRVCQGGVDPQQVEDLEQDTLL